MQKEEVSWSGQKLKVRRPKKVAIKSNQWIKVENIE